MPCFYLCHVGVGDIHLRVEVRGWLLEVCSLLELYEVQGFNRSSKLAANAFYLLNYPSSPLYLSFVFIWFWFFETGSL